MIGLEIANLAGVALVAAVGRLYFSEGVTVGLVLGASLMALNVMGLKALTRKMLSGVSGGKLVALSLLLIAKTGFILGATYFGMKFLDADGFGLAFGIMAAAGATAVGSMATPTTELATG